MDGEIKGYVYKNDQHKNLEEMSILRRAFVQGGKIDIFARWFVMKKISYTDLPLFSILRPNKTRLTNTEQFIYR